MNPKAPREWETLLDRLSDFYHTGDWRVPYLRDHAEDPFQVLIGTILSQRTRDENTARASARLFAKYPDARSLAAATPRQVEPLIRETGFYHTKARAIRATSRELLDRFGGVVPRTLEELTSLPGVGPKTANCVLVFGYGIPGMPVDTHVHRIANRLGLVRTQTPEETEAALRASVPERYWNPVNPLLVQHGQNLCRPIGPKCPECPIVDLCETGRALAEGRAPPRREDRPRVRRARSVRRVVPKGAAYGGAPLTGPRASMGPAFFRTGAEWRKWLSTHYDRSTECLVGFYRVGTERPSLTWPESVDQALCFGWIDGVRTKIDEDSYSIRFTPRRAGSTWSAVNIRRFAELAAAGQVHPAGLAAAARRTESKSRLYAYEQRMNPKFEPALEARFRSDAKAWSYFQSQAPYYQRVATYWVVSARLLETRLRRLETLIRDSASGQRIGPTRRSPG